MEGRPDGAPAEGHEQQLDECCCAHHDVTFALVQTVVGQLLVGAASVEDAGAGQVHEDVHCDDEEDVSISV